MRISGSLFTHTEMSASIADATFLQVSGSIITSSNKCVTVQEAMSTLRIAPIIGSGLRHPFYDELIASGSLPPLTGSSTITYSYTKQNFSNEKVGWVFAIEKTINSNTNYLMFANSQVPETTQTVESGSLLTVYMSFFDPMGNPNLCTTITMRLTVKKNNVTLYDQFTCPDMVYQNLSVGSNDYIEVIGLYTD